MTAGHVVPRPAATLILAREGAEGIDVFLLRRTQEAAFAGGAYVFPGGGLDPSDHDAQWSSLCSGLDDVAASRQLKLEYGGLAYWVAAVRECYEEAGLLLAYDSHGELLALDDHDTVQEFAALREQLIAGTLDFVSLCRKRGLKLALDHMAYFSHWITGQGRPRRYDTRFFVAVAPPRQTPSHDRGETVGHAWMKPAEALRRHRDGSLNLMFPTIKTLEALSRFSNASAVMDHARTERTMPPMTPRPAIGRDGERLLVPGDFAYAEVGKVDPTGHGHASYEILPGVVTRISSQVRRITAPNPGFMTGPGTNTYLLSNGGEVAVIDPGPSDEQHLQTLMEETGGRIRWILVTHTHHDHSPAAALLKERTGAELLGMPPPPHDRQDQTFRPDRVLAHGDVIEVGGCTLRVIHTPGHASNQLCYLLENERLLFTGDHIMQGSTVVINPPDGNMTQYLDSLRLLQSEDFAHFAPGHGFLMDKTQEMIERLLIHRLDRENKVHAALSNAGVVSIDALLPLVYDDVPARIHHVARRSLLAHLIKLRDEGRVRVDGERWRLS